MLCPYCENVILENSRFCNFCGNELGNNEQSSKVTDERFSSITFNKYRKWSIPIIFIIGITVLGAIWAFYFGPFAGPPAKLIITDHKFLIDRPNQIVQIIDKSRCSHLPSDIKALGIKEVWVVGIDIKNGDGYPITTIYMKQGGEWREVFSSECP